jgi:predicted NBD/HSP70 family sugar kinase/biotin operon repressor
VLANVGTGFCRVKTERWPRGELLVRCREEQFYDLGVGQPGSLERLRAANRRGVLGVLATEGPTSRAQLGRATGLSRTTVSNLVQELIEAGQVIETTDRGRPHKGGSGRPPVMVALAAPSGGVAGVDIGHRHLRVAIADRSGQVLAEDQASLDVDGHGGQTLARAAAMVSALLVRSGLERLHGAGMCLPAPIDRRSSRISSGILPGWRDLVPADVLERELGVPVTVDNDANLGALAELHHGAARGISDLVYLKVASGLGAGIVLGGRLHRGATGIAGEIGHVQIREDGHVCRCGNRGCLETEVAIPQLLALLQPAYDEPLDARRLQALDEEGDAGVRRVLSDAGSTMGRALADLCNSLNPEQVVIGGPLGAAPSLLQGVRTAMDRYAQPNTAAALRVVSGELADQAEVRGAIALAIARVASAD